MSLPQPGPLNFLTFDIEEWYHANYEGFDASRFASAQTNLAALVDRLIALCERHGIVTTCFILGSVARAKPGIVRALQSAGHEIASHGYGHETVHRLGPDAFRADLKLSCEILEDITGEKILGFRAPSFSVTRQSLGWYYDVLEHLGLAYSSSVFPGQTFLYGIPDFPDCIHHPVVDGHRRAILEFPVPLVKFFGTHMGLYIRFFPAWALLRRIRSDNGVGKPVTMYVHPREIDPDQPRMDLPYLQKRIHYWGISSCERKLDTILKALPCRFGRFRDHLPAYSPES